MSLSDLEILIIQAYKKYQFLRDWRPYVPSVSEDEQQDELRKAEAGLTPQERAEYEASKIHRETAPPEESQIGKKYPEEHAPMTKPTVQQPTQQEPATVPPQEQTPPNQTWYPKEASWK